jgi:AAA15 family ATPase/GTPase
MIKINSIKLNNFRFFTEFIQKLANKLNVQVFLTTHSKECIEAFVNNGYKNEDISYNLITKTLNCKEIKVINYDSEALISKLSKNLEIRGVIYAFDN